MKFIHDMLGIIMELLDMTIFMAESLSIKDKRNQYFVDIGREMYHIYNALKYLYYETEGNKVGELNEKL